MRKANGLIVARFPTRRPKSIGSTREASLGSLAALAFATVHPVSFFHYTEQSTVRGLITELHTYPKQHSHWLNFHLHALDCSTLHWFILFGRTDTAEVLTKLFPEEKTCGYIINLHAHNYKINHVLNSMHVR